MTQPSPPFAAPLLAALRAHEGMVFFRWLLLDSCGILRSPMAVLEADMRYLCGKQDIGYALLELLTEADPSFLAKLMEKPDANS